MIKKLFLLLLVSMTLSGCLPSISKFGGEKPVNPGDFAQGRIVSGFPNLPKFPEAQVIESINYQDSYGASFITKDTLDKVLTFYTDSLPQLGWDMQLVKRTETNFLLKVKNVQYEGEITINTASDGVNTAITYSISPR